MRREYVVAIDLGTSCTAFSWRGQSDPTVFVGVPDTDVRPEDVQGKTPTVLLIRGSLDPQGEVFKDDGVEAFGREAERRFREKKIPENAQLFQRFKMELHQQSRDATIDNLKNASTTSFTGIAELTLWDTFALALEHIKEVALKKLALAGVSPDRVSWVLTVPACCTLAAKNFMRDVAIKARLIQGRDDEEHLAIIDEPVAACLALEDSLDWRVGNKYLVVDCGGGTVDICAFELANVGPPSLKQVENVPNTSEAWGSTYVDKQFEVFLMKFARLVGAKRLQLASFKKDGMYRVLRNWEEAKIGLKSVEQSCRIDLSDMMKALNVEQPMQAMDRAREETNGSMDLVGGLGTDLVLKPEQLRRFFRSQCDSIAAAVSEKLNLKELEGLTSVVMVGGFAGSVHVQAAVDKSIEAKYPNGRVKRVVATSPDLAIVQGAALFVGSLGSGPKYPTSVPHFTGINCDSSYGILLSEPGSWEDATLFDVVLLKGKSYEHLHTKKFNYTINSKCKLALGSCDSPGVKLGHNKLSAIGGRTAVRITEFETIPVPGTGLSDKKDEGPQQQSSSNDAAKRGRWLGMCCWRGTSAVEQGEQSVINTETTIVVEFVILGKDLHVRVQSTKGEDLIKQIVRFQ
eukprot:g17245.t1